MTIMLFIYNILFPFVFMIFLPGLLWKLVRRGGKKDNFPERFAIFSKEKFEALKKNEGGVWMHSVSVGETQIALSLISKWRSICPDLKIMLSTTTTTGQALAVSKVPKDVPVIFCPLDFLPFVRKTLKILKPRLLVIFETEIWPNIICETRKNGIPVALVNARISDKSAKGYSFFSFFFAPILQKLSILCVQTEQDKKRFSDISENLPIQVCGNMKFDQSIPENLGGFDLNNYFGAGKNLILMAASTHPGEEELIAKIFKRLKSKYPELKLLIVPRHAERGGEIASILQTLGISFKRKTDKSNSDAMAVDCLLADTTGEMISLMAVADIVIMGKSFAGHDEGHNLIEPALLKKPIITGTVLRNFRFVLNALKEADALITVENDDKLESEIERLVLDENLRKELGEKANKTVEQHKGVTEKTIQILEKLL